MKKLSSKYLTIEPPVHINKNVSYRNKYMKLNSIIFCLCAGLCYSAMIENAFSMNEDNKTANKLCKLDSYSAMIASKYFTSEADFQNLEMVAKKHRGLHEKFHFNPISISPADLRFWPNLETLHIKPLAKRILYKN